MLTSILILVGGFLVAALLLIVLSSRHKKSASGDVVLVGRLGTVEAKLAPEGAVIVDGEMWRAQSRDGETIEVGTRVRVCGAQAHLIIVEPEVSGAG